MYSTRLENENLLIRGLFIILSRLEHDWVFSVRSSSSRFRAISPARGPLLVRESASIEITVSDVLCNCRLKGRKI